MDPMALVANEQLHLYYSEAAGVIQITCDAIISFDAISYVYNDKILNLQ